MSNSFSEDPLVGQIRNGRLPFPDQSSPVFGDVIDCLIGPEHRKLVLAHYSTHT